MNLTAAALLAMGLSFVVMGLATRWYVAPAPRRRPDLASALTPLLWLHAFRYVVLLIFSAQAQGLVISDALRDQLVIGDLVGAGLAVASIVLLRGRSRAAIPVAWLFVVATLADIAHAAWEGLAQGLFDSASGWPWAILIFYVPALTLSAALAGWLMWRWPAGTVNGGAPGRSHHLGSPRRTSS